MFRIKRVRLYEVSVVTFPAYEDTSVEARKAELATIVKRRVEEKRRLALERLKGVNYGN